MQRGEAAWMAGGWRRCIGTCAGQPACQCRGVAMPSGMPPRRLSTCHCNRRPHQSCLPLVLPPLPLQHRRARGGARLWRWPNLARCLGGGLGAQPGIVRCHRRLHHPLIIPSPHCHLIILIFNQLAEPTHIACIAPNCQFVIIIEINQCACQPQHL